MKPPSPATSRRGFLRVALAAATGAAWGGCAALGSGGTAGGTKPLELAALPKGAAPAPVPLPHFPSRLHAFVWRNWELVPVERMARVVGASPGSLRQLGRALGLRTQPRITPDQQRRSYIAVIKRNWHLLPYPQLLELLGWSARELAYTLREDDFLYVKLGNLKPACAPLRYDAPDARAQQDEDDIRRVLGEELGPREVRPQDPLFGFVSQLSAKIGARLLQGPRAAPGLRLCHSYFAPYGDPLLDPQADPYPDGYLARLAECGVNAVWLQAVLYKLAPFPWEPGLSARHEERLRNLRGLVARARRHGIRVFLYLNEPRAMPLPFFEDRPGLRGVVENDHATLCTSVDEVGRFLVDSVAAICRAVPGLGGFFTITASENLTNCWSHGGGASCPRCGVRSPAEVIAAVNRLVFEGIRAARSGAELVVWDWGWDDRWAADAIRQLPPAAAFMSVSEWGLPIERGGVKSTVGEYSISAVGPGPRAQRHWALARQRGMKVVAKIQAGNSWELSSVPHLPVCGNVAQHAVNLSRCQVDGVMLGWTLGGYPSPNLEIVAEVMAGASAEAAMRRVAERRFGRALAPAVATAWQGFSLAFQEYPFHVGALYSGPQQLGPANLLWSGPTGYRASMVGFPYDDLDAWRAIYPPIVYGRQFERVADGFDQCLGQLRAAAAALPAQPSKSEMEAFEEECRVAEAAAIHFRSVANQARFVLARGAVMAASATGEREPLVVQLEHILREEISLACRLRQLQLRDSRLGFEASNHYFYTPADLAEKVLNCRDLLERWLPRLRPGSSG